MAVGRNGLRSVLALGAVAWWAQRAGASLYAPRMLAAAPPHPLRPLQPSQALLLPPHLRAPASAQNRSGANGHVVAEDTLAVGVARSRQLAAVAAPPLLHPIFSDHAVLQRNQAGAFFGWHTPRATLSLQLAGGGQSWHFRARAGAHGRWRVPYSAHSGGPYRLTVRGAGGRSRYIQNIYFGEVFLLSGQSNARQSLRDLASDHDVGAFWRRRARATMGTLNNPRVHLLRLDTQRGDRAAAVPLSSARWFLPTQHAAELSRFSALGYLFARGLQPRLGVHVGIMLAAVPGSSIRPWMSPRAISTLGRASGESGPSQLFHGMIAPLGGIGLRSVLWYQGENEARAPSELLHYGSSLKALVADWRRNFAAPHLPFVVVGLSGYPGPRESGGWGWVRDAQRRVAARVGVLVTTADCGDPRTIHPPDKFTIADRLVRAVWASQFGANLPAAGPAFVGLRRQGLAVRALFSRADGGLVRAHKAGAEAPRPLPGRRVYGFEYQNPAGQWRPVHAATLEGTTVRLTAYPHRILRVRYAFRNAPTLTVYARGSRLPAAPFVSD